MYLSQTVNFWYLPDISKSFLTPMLYPDHAQIQKVLSVEVQIVQRFFFFKKNLVDEGQEDPNTTLSGPSSARQQNAI